jgi:molecular chaperone DnaK
MHVTAKDKATSKEAKITIKANSGLSEEEIQKMVRDAEANAAEDHKAFELATARNQCDSMIHSVKKALKDYGEKVSGDEKAKIEEAIKAAEDAIRGTDKDDIEAKTQALAEASHKLAEQMYGQQGGAEAGAQPGAGASAGKAEDDVVDAEFEEVKDK